MHVPEIYQRLVSNPESLAVILEEIANAIDHGHPIVNRYLLPQALMNLKLAIPYAQEDSEALLRYAIHLERDPTTPSIDHGLGLLANYGSTDREIIAWADSLRDYAASWREWVQIHELERQQREYTVEKIPKSLLCKSLDISADKLQRMLKADPALQHPDSKPASRSIRFDKNALINTEIYLPSMRAAAVAAWGQGKTRVKKT